MLQMFQARYVLDMLLSTELPTIASELLIHGYDTPALRVLAGALPAEAISDGFGLLDQALAALHQPALPADQAVRIMITPILQAAVAGQLDVVSASQQILELARYSHPERPEDLEVFMCSADLIDSYPNDTEYSQQMLEAATTWLAQQPT